ncbi:tripartite tricarboxylate transporter substrate binding protein [Ramlibacter sp.]|uniref:tripartite tricarboxylate transporter substrate binding protein n=1 Tax=Ramlibacter sp. TaxID=1917967 RepID=UPI00260D1631|nr:tripartite tricarboxylate transporter substrate binding protein [Ramlibacter sp.]MDB5955443.1 Tripartite-type tricarboxylate transporter, receptor component TctC [Ramlibacter sp.]
MSKFLPRLWYAACTAGLALFAAAAFAQDAFPSGPITLVVPNPPGGASDINARLLVEPWAAALKQPVVISNKPGLGGAIGTAQVAKAKADGYTVLMALSAVVVAPEAEKVSGRKPLYELEQLEPLGLVSSDPMVVLVRSDAPYKSLGELIAAAKDKPGALNYSSSGNFGPIHLSVEMLAHEAGVKFTQVPFSGSAPSLLAVLSGQVQFTTAAPAVARAQIESGKVRALAVSGGKRLPLLPNVPTYREAGYDAEFYIWAGLYAPAGTPRPVVQKLRETLGVAARSQAFTAGMAKQSIIYDYRDAPEFARFAEEDRVRLTRVVRAIGKVE